MHYFVFERETWNHHFSSTWSAVHALLIIPFVWFYGLTKPETKIAKNYKGEQNVEEKPLCTISVYSIYMSIIIMIIILFEAVHFVLRSQVQNVVE